MSAARVYVQPPTGRATTTSLTVGLLGLGLTGKIQNSLHSAFGSEQANGWNNQISDGGELTYRYSVANQKILGRLRTPWWTFAPQLGEYTEGGSVNGVFYSASRNDEMYFWSGFNVRLRAYNALLEDQFRDSAVTYNRSELSSFIGEAWMGVSKEFNNGFRFSYFIRAQTSEIKSGPGSRDPIWGGAIFSFVTP